MVSGGLSANILHVISATAYPSRWCSHLPGNTAMLYAQWYHQLRRGLKRVTVPVARVTVPAAVVRTGGVHEDDHGLAAALASTRHHCGARGVRLSHRQAYRA